LADLTDVIILFGPGGIRRNQGTATSGGGASVQGRGHTSGFDEVSGDRERYSKKVADSGEMYVSIPGG
jgi:hypothetical protein